MHCSRKRPPPGLFVDWIGLSQPRAVHSASHVSYSVNQASSGEDTSLSMMNFDSLLKACCTSFVNYHSIFSSLNCYWARIDLIGPPRRQQRLWYTKDICFPLHSFRGPEGPPQMSAALENSHANATGAEIPQQFPAFAGRRHRTGTCSLSTEVEE